MKNTLIAVVAVLVLGAGGWYYYVSSKAAVPTNPAAANNQASSTVATVNGEAILQPQLVAAETQITAQQGTSTTMTAAQIQTQALDSLIAQVLVRQAAQQAGATASSTQIDAQLKSTKAQFATPEAYQQALTAQGMTEDTLRAQIGAALAIQNYLEQTLKLSAVTASDAEIQAAYKQVAAAQTGVPPLAQVRDQVKTLVIQQKQQQLVNDLVQKLRTAGDVKVLI